MANFELDHLVIFVSPDGPEAKAVEAAGLQGFGGVTRHGDLGSASTAFFFYNLTYLELLWLTDEEAARRNFEPLSMNTIPRTHWRETGAVPFGLMLRRQAGDGDSPVPFTTRNLEVNGHYVHFNGTTLTEPNYGVVPEPMSFRGFRANIEDVEHPLGVKNLTSVTIDLPTADRSPIAHFVVEGGIVNYVTASQPNLTLTFDNGSQGRTVDLNPILPLLLRC
jgi:PAS domain-containing protein